MLKIFYVRYTMNIIASGLGKASFYRKGHIRTLFLGWDTFKFKDWSRFELLKKCALDLRVIKDFIHC